MIIRIHSYRALEIQSITNYSLKPANRKELELFILQDKIDELKLVALINKQKENQIANRLNPVIRNQSNGNNEPVGEGSCLLPEVFIIFLKLFFKKKCRNRVMLHRDTSFLYTSKDSISTRLIFSSRSLVLYLVFR
jgi:hypothetical protein